jgi:hypothetical protein
VISVNLKTALLIVLIVSAVVATFFALETSAQTLYQKSVYVDEHQSAVETCNRIIIEPMEEIDTPGGPT